MARQPHVMGPTEVEISALDTWLLDDDARNLEVHALGSDFSLISLRRFAVLSWQQVWLRGPSLLKD